MALNNLGLGIIMKAQDLASGVISKVSGSFKELNGVAGMVARDSMRQFTIGLGVMGAGLAGLAILDSTTAAASEFGKSIALVATEADKSVFSQDEMSDVALRLAGQYGKMPADQAAAMYKAVALGADDATKANALLTSANQLAVAGNADLKDVTDALGGSINAYGLEAKDAGRVSDAFFIAMKNGNTTVQDLATSVGRVSSGAHAMNISVEEILGATSVMTNKGIKAAEAVTYLHGALANIVHPSKEATAEASRMGIKFNETALRTQGLVGFLHSIADNSKLTATSMNKLFTSVEGAQGMSMLAGDMKSVDAIMAKMGKSAGATAEGFDILAETTAFQEERFKALAKTAEIRIGEVLDPMKGKMLQAVNGIITGFTNLPGPVMKSLVTFASFAAAAVASAGAIAVLLAGVKLAAIGLFAFGGPVLAGVVLAMGPAIAILGAGALAFVALRQAYNENIGGIGDMFGGAVSKVVLAWKAVVSLFQTGGFSGELLTELDAGNQGVMNFAINVYVWFNRIKAFWDGVVEGFHHGVAVAAPTFDRLVAAVTQLGTRLGFLSAEADTLANGGAFAQAGEDGRSMGEKIANAATKIVDGISRAMEEADHFIDTLDKSGLSATEMKKDFDMLVHSIGTIIGVFGTSGSATVTWGAQLAATFIKVISYIEQAIGGFESLIAMQARIKHALPGGDNRQGALAKLDYEAAQRRVYRGHQMSLMSDDISRGMSPEIASQRMKEVDMQLSAKDTEAAWLRHTLEPVQKASQQEMFAQQNAAPATAAEGAAADQADQTELFATMAAASTKPAAASPVTVPITASFNVDGEQFASYAAMISTDRDNREGNPTGVGD